MSEIINCPVCSHLLIKEQNTYKCENNHTFDLAKEGYLNLLFKCQKNFWRLKRNDGSQTRLSRQRLL